jgi:hypothetical protein
VSQIIVYTSYRVSKIKITNSTMWHLKHKCNDVVWKIDTNSGHCMFQFTTTTGDDTTWLPLPRHVNVSAQTSRDRPYSAFCSHRTHTRCNDNRLMTDPRTTCFLRCTQNSDVVLHTDVHTTHTLYQRSTEAAQHKQNVLSNRPNARMKLEDLQNKHGCVVVNAWSPRTHDTHGAVVVVKRCPQKTNAVSRWLLTHAEASLRDFVMENIDTVDTKYAVDATGKWFNRRALNAMASNALHVCAGYASDGAILNEADAVQCKSSTPLDTSLYVLYKDDSSQYRTWHPSTGAEWSSCDVAQLLLAHALDTTQPSQSELRNTLLRLLENTPYEEAKHVDTFTVEDVKHRQTLVDENTTNHQKHTMLLQSNRAEDMFDVSLTADECAERAAACEESHTVQSLLDRETPNNTLVQQENDLVNDIRACITPNNKFVIQQLDVVASAHVQLGEDWHGFLPSVLKNQCEFPADTPIRLCHKLEPEDVELKPLYTLATRQMLIESAAPNVSEPTSATHQPDEDDMDCFEVAAMHMATQDAHEPTAIASHHHTNHQIGSKFADILCGDQYVALSVHCDSV